MMNDEKLLIYNF